MGKGLGPIDPKGYAMLCMMFSFHSHGVLNILNNLKLNILPENHSIRKRQI